MEAAGATAWRGKAALLRGDLAAFGRLMVENHRLVNEMMAYCGVEGEGVDATNALIDAALQAGALGASSPVPAVGAPSLPSCSRATSSVSPRPLTPAWTISA